MSIQLELDTQILSSTASSIDILLESQTLSGSSSVELVLEPSVITVETDLSGGWTATTGLTGATGPTGPAGPAGAYADLTGLPTLPSSTIVGISDTQTLTNKTVTDASFAIQDDLDNTKKAVFQCANITTGTTFTYTFPATSGTFITDAGAQSITGLKTFAGGTQNFGSSVAASTCNIAYGATTTGVTKTVNIGTAGLSGSTTNINIGSAVSGALGYISLQAPSVNIAQTGTNVNYFSIIGNTTGNNPQIQAVGSDTNINLTLVPKGTGFTFARSDFTFRGNLSMQSTSIAGNPVIFYVSDQSGATVTEYGRQDGVASAAILDFHTGATVTDYDSRVNATGGTGISGGGNLQFVASNVYLAGLATANSSLQVSTVTSAVNSVKITGAITTASPTIAAQGTDTNIDLSLSAKGTGSIVSNAPIQLKNYTIATLPTAGTAGRRAYVTDAYMPTFLGALISGPRTNLMFPSNAITGWTASPGSSVAATANAATSPDGTTNATKLATNDTTSNGHTWYKTYAGAINTAYCGSVYLKAGEYTRAQIAFDNSSFVAPTGALFDLAAGTVVATGGGSTATITLVGNGWYRCSVTATSDADGGNYVVTLTPVPSSISSFNSVYIPASTGLGIYVYGVQVETGSIATTYVPTTTAAATGTAVTSPVFDNGTAWVTA